MADTIVYTSDEADPSTAWPGDPKNLGRGLGEYQARRPRALLADDLEFLTGGRYRGSTSPPTDSDPGGE